MCYGQVIKIHPEGGSNLFDFQFHSMINRVFQNDKKIKILFHAQIQVKAGHLIWIKIYAFLSSIEDPHLFVQSVGDIGHQKEVMRQNIGLKKMANIPPSQDWGAAKVLWRS